MQNSTAPYEPKLIASLQEAQILAGYRKPDEDTGMLYGISAQIYTAFALYGIAPIVAINVLGSDGSHYEDITAESFDLSDGRLSKADRAELSGVFLETLVVTDTGAQTTYVEGTDYVVEFDTNGLLSFELLPGSTIGDDDTLEITATSLDASALGADTDPIIGGVDASGNKTGLEAITEVPQATGVVPTTIVVPHYSADTEIAAIMAAKCRDIGGLYGAVCIIDDVEIDGSLTSKAIDSKLALGLNKPQQIYAPYAYALGGVNLPASVHVSALMKWTDGTMDDVPSRSPSNKGLQIDSAWALGGTDPVPVLFGKDEADVLNANGVTIPFNRRAGWVLWGNRTAAYPSITDPKDSFIPIRRMFDWTGNSLIDTFWNRVDNRLTPVEVQTWIDSTNSWFEGLAKAGHIISGEASFEPDANPIGGVAQGKVRFNIRMAPPTPLEDAQFILEYDITALTQLFE